MARRFGMTPGGPVRARQRLQGLGASHAHRHPVGERHAPGTRHALDPVQGCWLAWARRQVASVTRHEAHALYPPIPHGLAQWIDLSIVDGVAMVECQGGLGRTVAVGIEHDAQHGCITTANGTDGGTCRQVAIVVAVTKGV